MSISSFPAMLWLLNKVSVLTFAERELGKLLVIQTGIVIELLARYRVITDYSRYANRRLICA